MKRAATTKTHVLQKWSITHFVPRWIQRLPWKWRERRCRRLMLAVMELRNSSFEGQWVAYFDLDEAAQRLCVATDAFKQVGKTI